jgi:hypothetical protein
MFRKGGNVGDGIMTGIVDREMHAVSDPNGVGEQSELKQKVEDKMALIEAISGGNSDGLNDPFTQFLLQYGPAIANKKPTGNIFSTAIGATEGPIKNLLETQAKTKATRTAVGMEVLKDLSDEDTKSLRDEAEKLAADGAMGGDVDKIFKSLVDKYFYRDPKQPGEQQKEKDLLYITSLIDNDEYLNAYTGEEVVNAINSAKAGKVPGLDASTIFYEQPYIPSDIVYETDSDTGVLTLDENDQDLYPQGVAVYNFRTKKWYNVQGQTLVPVGG